VSLRESLAFLPEQVVYRENFLRLLPNLRTLSIDGPSQGFHFSSLTKARLNSLKLDFGDFGWANATSVFDADDGIHILMRHLNLASLRHFAILSFNNSPKDFYKLFPASRYGTSLITSLHFYDYGYDDIDLVSYALKSVRALQSFTLQIYRSEGSILPVHPGKDFVPALQRHLATVEELAIASEYKTRFDTGERFGVYFAETAS
jgi:hypothetical protein